MQCNVMYVCIYYTHHEHCPNICLSVWLLIPSHLVSPHFIHLILSFPCCVRICIYIHNIVYSPLVPSGLVWSISASVCVLYKHRCPCLCVCERTYISTNFHRHAQQQFLGIAFPKSWMSCGTSAMNLSYKWSKSNLSEHKKTPWQRSATYLSKQATQCTPHDGKGSKVKVIQNASSHQV